MALGGHGLGGPCQCCPLVVCHGRGARRLLVSRPSRRGRRWNRSRHLGGEAGVEEQPLGRPGVPAASPGLRPPASGLRPVTPGLRCNQMETGDDLRVEQGCAATSEGRYAEAYATLRPLADAGNAEAQGVVGSLLLASLHRRLYEAGTRSSAGGVGVARRARPHPLVVSIWPWRWRRVSAVVTPADQDNGLSDPEAPQIEPTALTSLPCGPAPRPRAARAAGR